MEHNVKALKCNIPFFARIPSPRCSPFSPSQRCPGEAEAEGGAEAPAGEGHQRLRPRQLSGSTPLGWKAGTNWLQDTFPSRMLCLLVVLTKAAVEEHTLAQCGPGQRSCDISRSDVLYESLRAGCAAERQGQGPRMEPEGRALNHRWRTCNPAWNHRGRAWNPGGRA